MQLWGLGARLANAKPGWGGFAATMTATMTATFTETSTRKVGTSTGQVPPIRQTAGMTQGDQGI